MQVLHPVHCTHGNRCLHCSQCAQCTHCIHCSQWNPCTHSLQFTVSHSYRRRLESLKRTKQNPSCRLCIQCTARTAVIASTAAKATTASIAANGTPVFAASNVGAAAVCLRDSTLTPNPGTPWDRCNDHIALLPSQRFRPSQSRWYSTACTTLPWLIATLTQKGFEMRTAVILLIPTRLQPQRPK